MPTYRVSLHNPVGELSHRLVEVSDDDDDMALTRGTIALIADTPLHHGDVIYVREAE